MRGMITYIDLPKGWGYIVGEDDGDIKKRFFHVSACHTDFEALQVGNRVTFDPALDPKGYRAIGVKLEEEVKDD